MHYSAVYTYILTSSWSWLGLFAGFVGPGAPPGGTGTIVTNGIVGNGIGDGGQSWNVMSMSSRWIVIWGHMGPPEPGLTVFVGLEPASLVTVISGILIFSVVITGGVTV